MRVNKTHQTPGKMKACLIKTMAFAVSAFLLFGATSCSSAPKKPTLPSEAAKIAAETPADSKETISQTDPKFINNEQPQDFFQGVGDAPAGQALFGPAFDSMFTPPNPANQPVSSTSYEQIP